MRDRDEYAQQRDAPPLAEHGEGAPRALLAAKLVDRHGATGRLAAIAAEDERLDARGKRAATRHRSRSFTVAASRRSSSAARTGCCGSSALLPGCAGDRATDPSSRTRSRFG